MKKRIIELIVQIAEINDLKVDETTRFCDIPEWDSLKSISLVSSIEMEFSISISMSQIYKIETVKDLMNAIENI